MPPEAMGSMSSYWPNGVPPGRGLAGFAATTGGAAGFAGGAASGLTASGGVAAFGGAAGGVVAGAGGVALAVPRSPLTSSPESVSESSFSTAVSVLSRRGLAGFGAVLPSSVRVFDSARSTAESASRVAEADRAGPGCAGLEWGAGVGIATR